MTLAPTNKTSGGGLLSSKTQPSANRATAMLRLARTCDEEICPCGEAFGI